MNNELQTLRLFSPLFPFPEASDKVIANAFPL